MSVSRFIGEFIAMLSLFGVIWLWTLLGAALQTT